MVKVFEGGIGVGVGVAVVVVGYLVEECLAFVEKGTFWRGLSIAGSKMEQSPSREGGMGPSQSLGWAPPS